MAYVACDIVTGTAHVAYTDELTDLAWVRPSEFRLRALRFAPVVQDYLRVAIGSTSQRTVSVT